MKTIIAISKKAKHTIELKLMKIVSLMQERYLIWIAAVRKPTYFIIRYKDKMSCGWAVWERLVLYNSIWAVDHNMIPVVDMQSQKNIYLESDEVGKVNAWEKFYNQPGRVTLKEAMNSNSYILSIDSQNWFFYIRGWKKELNSDEYLRNQFQKYISLNIKTERYLHSLYVRLLEEQGLTDTSRLLGICLRGTDYKIFGHPKQPATQSLKNDVEVCMKKYNCDGIYIATEDKAIFEELKELFKNYKLFFYKAGEIESTDSYIGKEIRKGKSADEAALDYLMVLYSLNKCICLIGGVCGATNIAKFKRKEPYEYYRIIELNEFY